MPEPAKKIDVGPAPTTVSEVINFAEQCDRRGKSLARIYERLEENLAANRTEMEERYASINISPAEKLNAMGQEVDTHRLAVLEDSADERKAALAHIRAISDQVELTAELFASPVALLTNSELGSERVDVYLRQLEGGGPLRLKQASLLAGSSGNKQLACALVILNDAMPRKDRAFSSIGLAEQVMAAEWAKIQEARAIISHRVSSVSALDRGLTHGRGGMAPVDRIASGLQRREIAKLKGEAE